MSQGMLQGPPPGFYQNSVSKNFWQKKSFVSFLRFLAAASIPTGLVMGSVIGLEIEQLKKPYSDAPNFGMVIMGLFWGVINMAWWGALSTIVETCQKKLDSK